MSSRLATDVVSIITADISKYAGPSDLTILSLSFCQTVSLKVDLSCNSMFISLKKRFLCQDEFFLILNKYWECHEITECLKIYSWSKHVKQINEFLMAMRNIWWHLCFNSVRQFFFQSDRFSNLPDRMSDKLSWIFDMSVTAVEIAAWLYYCY